MTSLLLVLLAANACALLGLTLVEARGKARPAQAKTLCASLILRTLQNLLGVTALGLLAAVGS